MVGAKKALTRQWEHQQNCETALARADAVSPSEDEISQCASAKRALTEREQAKVSTNAVQVASIVREVANALQTKHEYPTQHMT